MFYLLKDNITYLHTNINITNEGEEGHLSLCGLTEGIFPGVGSHLIISEDNITYIIMHIIFLMKKEKGTPDSLRADRQQLPQGWQPAQANYIYYYCHHCFSITIEDNIITNIKC